MCAMILSSVKRFIEISPQLESLGIKNIHFYNSTNNEKLTTPMLSLVPFVDVVVLGRDAYCSPLMNRVVEEALARHIPIFSEESLKEMTSFQEMI